MHDRFGSSGFLPAYNVGPTRYENHLATGRPLPDETGNYVASLAPLLPGTLPSPTGTSTGAPHIWQTASLSVPRSPRKSDNALLSFTPQSPPTKFTPNIPTLPPLPSLPHALLL